MFPARTPIDLTRAVIPIRHSPRAAAKEHWLFRGVALLSAPAGTVAAQPTFSPLRHHIENRRTDQPILNPPFRRPYDKCYSTICGFLAGCRTNRYWKGTMSPGGSGSRRKFRGRHDRCAEAISTGRYAAVEFSGRATRRRGLGVAEWLPILADNGCLLRQPQQRREPRHRQAPSRLKLSTPVLRSLKEKE